MNILVIGSGGREHAICKALKKSPHLKKLFCMPGNGGIEQDALCVPARGTEEIVGFCKDEGIDLVIVGPEQPLVDGVTDALRAENIRVFGPSQKAAQLEASKGFTKEICKKYHIPTAGYGWFDDPASALDYLAQQSMPIVIKADGLAAGKGVIIAHRRREAERVIEEMFAGKFGDASSSVVIEEFLEGEEVSFFALSDGESAVEFGSAQDHKAAFDGDTGPNTGGMGTYAPAPVMTPELREQVMQTIILPTVKAMKEEGTPYQGVLFAGLMLTNEGPKLIEFNCRFGDPETQVLMTRLKSDLIEILYQTASGALPKSPPLFHDQAALCVVMAAKGYPNDYEKGTEIKNLEKASEIPDVTIYHAGTKRDGDRFFAAGGRVLGVTSVGDTIEDAQARAYSAVDAIDWPEGFCRRDIGWRAMQKKAS
ncbi:MAG: phosphoribosylamine--glycine ligase [Rickettsiales bacterium]